MLQHQTNVSPGFVYPEFQCLFLNSWMTCVLSRIPSWGPSEPDWVNGESETIHIHSLPIPLCEHPTAEHKHVGGRYLPSKTPQFPDITYLHLLSLAKGLKAS